MPYAQLDQGILDSTIWSEPMATKIVWITMLAMKNRHGYVGASIPGLAKRAGVTIEECEAALSKLLSPDPYSRTKDNEGRRIEIADRGWNVLNHKHFSERDPDKRKEQNRIAQSRFKAKVSQGKPESASEIHNVDVDVDVDSDSNESSFGVGVPLLLESKISRRATSRVKPREMDGFAEWYAAYPRHVARIAAARAYATALKRATPDELMAGAQRYAHEVSDRDPDKIKHPATWLNGGCWADEAPKPKISYYEKLDAFAAKLKAEERGLLLDGEV